jgi:hypothetical protein
MKTCCAAMFLTAIAALSTCSAAALAAADSPGPDRVLVVYNASWTSDEDGDGVQDSLEVAQYYMAKRGVPAANILGLAIADTDWSGDYGSDAAEYAKLQTQIIQPIKAKLAALGPANIDIILMSYHLPVGYKGQSIDNLLIGLNSWNTSADNVNWSNNPYLEPAPTFGADNGHFDHTYKFNGTDMYLVTRLDGPLGVRGCLNMIDQAIYADKFLAPGAGYFNGNVYIDSRGDKGADHYTDALLTADADVSNGWYGSYAQTDVNIAYGEHYVLGSGFTLKWQAAGGIIGSAGGLFADGSSAETAPRAFLYGGWYAYNTYLDVWEWLPGSVACDLNSSSLCYYWFRNPGSLAWAGQALNHGATCVQGVAGEPYTTGHQRPNIMIWAMLNGFNFAEAAGLSTPTIGWMPINLGDPLYRPLKPGKALVKDVRAPALAAGYPKVTQSENRGNEVQTLVDDAVEPEVCRVRVDYGTTVSYGLSMEDKRYFRRHLMRFDDLASATTYHYRLTLTDPVGNAVTTGDYTFTTPVQGPYGGTAALIPGVIQVENFDTGGEGIAYHDADPANNGGSWMFRGDTGVDTWGSADPLGAPSFVAQTTAGEWLAYTVFVTQSGLYTLDAGVGCFNGSGGIFHIEFDGADKTGPVAMPVSGSTAWDTWQIVSKSGLSLSSGTRVMRLSMDANTNGSFGSFNYLRFTRESGGSPVYGDADGNGVFELADLNVLVDWLLLRSAPPASGSAAFIAADVDGNGKIELADLNLYVDRLLGRITKFPIEP